jgi:hypothetical protein
VKSSPSQSVSPVKRLLSTPTATPRETPRAIDVDQLRKVLSFAPTARHSRRSTLLEAIDVLNLENPHSDFLAWLLDATGPLTDMWLLRLLFAKCLPGEPWPGKPIVEREVCVDGGRADIVVSWDSFRLIIENKVWSQEGEGQVGRYLLGFGIVDGTYGRLVYLTPHGGWPSSVPEDDDRVKPLSYRGLAELLESGLKAEPSERGRVFAAELRDGIYRLLKIRIDMTKPLISEPSRLLLANAKQFGGLKQQAINESADFILWLYSEAERRLKRILGTGLKTVTTGYGVYFHLPEWKSGEIKFGISYAMGADPRTRFVAEHNEQPCVGVAVFMSDGSEDKVCQPVSDRLHRAISKIWPHPADLSQSYYAFPLWRYIPIPSDGNMDRWAEGVLALLEEMTKKLARGLSAVAAELNAGK